MICNIFQDRRETGRLAVQNSLLKEYEQPIYQRVLESRQGQEKQWGHPPYLLPVRRGAAGFLEEAPGVDGGKSHPGV